MSQSFPLDLANGQQIIPIIGGTDGGVQVVVAAATPPAAGTITIEYQLRGSNAWVAFDSGSNQPLTAPVVVYGYGAIQAIRTTIAGLSGGAGLVGVVGDVDPLGFPIGIFTGTRAIVAQPYTEANVKNGLQYYLRAVWPTADPIANGTPRKIWVKTGAKPVIVKLRDLQYFGEEVLIELFNGPTGVTGGTALNINNYNGVNPVATTVQAKKNVTTTGNGTKFGGGDDEYFFGSSQANQRTQASIPQGRERILPPNSEFLVQITCTGAGSARVQYYLDWYEGTPDLPRP